VAGRQTQPEARPIFVARSTGVIKVGGTEYRYLKGRTRIAAGHPLLRAIPERFEPLQLDYDVQRPAPAEVEA
jgi:hypothetical protein